MTLTNMCAAALLLLLGCGGPAGTTGGGHFLASGAGLGCLASAATRSRFVL